MADSGFFLTYDLRILYCPNLQIINNCKELNIETHSFSQYDGSVDSILNSYSLPGEEVDDIVKNILTGEIGDELPPENMEWLITFEDLLKEDNSLITNRDLTFNYLILKLILMGFSQDKAKDIVINYYEKILLNVDVPHPQIFLNQINKFLSYKRFWVKSNIKTEKLREFKMMKKILKVKDELGYTFEFEPLFKQEYLEVIKSSFVPQLIYFNQTPSYLVKEKVDLNTQIPYLTQVYQEFLYGIILKICQTDNKMYDETFINSLLKEMTAVLKLYLTIHSNDFA